MNALSDRLDVLQASAANLAGARAILINEKASLVGAYAKHHAWLASEDKLKKAVTEIQGKVIGQQKAVYENLLTSLVQETFGQKAGRVVLEVAAYKGKPTLDVYLSRDGELEDVYLDRGGSVTNVISVGLRVISLIRSSNRRLLVLDEADCWMSADTVQRLAKVLQQLGKTLGFQTVFITHLPIQHYDARFDLLRTADRGVAVERQGATQDEGSYLRSIRLRNFQAYVDATFSLSAGFNVVVGQNDIGKSCLTSALMSVARGKSRKSLIRRGADYAEVELGFTDGSWLIQRINKSGSPAVTYQYVLANGSVEYDHRDARKLPEWLDDVLSMPLQDELDINVSHQKKPVFLLGEDATASQRAKILSVGLDFLLSSEMSIVLREKVLESKSATKRIQERISQIDSAVEAARYLATVEEQIEKGRSLLDEGRRLKGLSETVKSLEAASGVEGVGDLLPSIGQLPALCTEEFSHDVHTLRALESVVNFSTISPFEPLPQEVSVDLRHLAGVAEALRLLEGRAVAPSPDLEDAKLVGSLVGLSRLEGLWFDELKAFDTFDYQTLISIGKGLVAGARLAKMEFVDIKPLVLTDFDFDVSLFEVGEVHSCLVDNIGKQTMQCPACGHHIDTGATLHA